MSELSAEDRARLEALVITATEGSELDGDDWAALMYVGSFQVAALTRALALIDQQAKDYRQLQDDYFEQKQMRKDFANEADALRERCDQQAKALEAADELARVVGTTTTTFSENIHPKSPIALARAYRSTRTTTEGEDA